MITLWLLSLIHSDVVVFGETTCPNPAIVSAALAEGAANAQSEGRLHLGNSAGGVALTFTDSMGQSRTRILPATGSCEDQAVRASVVVAAWLAAPEPLSLPPIDVHLHAAPLPVQSAPAWLIAAGPRLSVDGGGIGWGGQADVTRRFAQSAWAAKVRIGIMGPRDVEVGPGKATWMQVELAPAIVRNVWKRAALKVQVDAGPSLSLITAVGEGVPAAQRDSSFVWGGGLALRGYYESALPMFIEARSTAWVREPNVVVTGADMPEHRTRLRALVAMVSFGFAFHL